MLRDYFGESKNIEFKREIPARHDKLLKDIIAFANTNGGKCIIGIDDKTLEVVGIGERSPFKMSDTISTMISDACTPYIEHDIYPATVEDKTVVVIDVFPGKHRPYYIVSKGKECSTYIRVNGTSRLADQITLKELELQGNNLSYDCMVEIGADFDEDMALDFCRKANEIALANCKNDDEKMNVKDMTIGKLEDMGIVCRNGNSLAPTNAFMLLTSNKSRFAKTQCALFKGNNRDVFLDKKEFDGPIYEQLTNAYNFVLRHINMGAQVDGLFREDIYELPLKSIRELLANAIIHRSYLIDSKIQVSIFDDRLEVVSPGMLYGGMDFDTMKAGRSKCRNQAIADIFQYMKIVEAWGTGIPRMIAACKQYKLPDPLFEEFGDGIKVTLYRQQANKRTSKQANKRTSEQANKKTNKHIDVIMRYMAKTGEATTAEIAAKLGLSPARTRAILAQIEEIEAVGVTNARRYRLK